MWIAGAATIALALGMATLPPAEPAAALSPDLPFSADALPTWQTDGVVWAMAASRGKMVIGGSFNQIRPGAGQSGASRNQRALAILDAATGQPDACQLTPAYSGGAASVYAVEAAPDGNTVFVGGQFTSINGTAVSRLAEIDVASCTVRPFRVSGISNYVLSIEASADAVYFGGVFQTVAGQSRRSFAKVTRAGALLPFTANVSGATEDLYSTVVVPNKNARGNALALSPDGQRLAIGGDWFDVNGTASHSFAVVDSTSGAVLRTWPANTVGNTSRTKMISSDGTRFFVAQEGFNGFDGSLAFNWSDYSQAWRDNCAGATQAVVPYNGLLFEAHHHHDCGSMGMFPDGRRTFLSVTHADDPTQRHIQWLPELNDGTGEGIGPRSIVAATGANGTPYLWVGGEFTRVNGSGQQGLTRFGPTDTGTLPVPQVAARAITSGEIQVNIRGVYDEDDSDISYAVYRGSNTTTPVWTGSTTSTHWYQHQTTFVDTGVSPGTTYSYRVRAIDAAGNQSALSAAVTATASASGSSYASGVLAAQPRLYYRYDDTANAQWVVDSSAQPDGLNGLAQNGVTRTAAGAIVGDSSRSATFNDAQSSGRPQYIWNDVIAPGPTTYSIESWFRTTSVTGGALVNYGSYQGRPRSDTGADRVSSTVDRVVYMENGTGHLRFGVRAGFSSTTLRSTSPLNDGTWHHVVAVQGADGMLLYIDGELQAQNATSGSGTYSGTWHVGGDNLSGYPSAGSSQQNRYFDGQIDETAVYYRAITAAEIAGHFDLGNAVVDTTAPTVPDGLSATAAEGTVQLEWNASTDAGGVGGYRVYRGTASGFEPAPGSLLATVAGTTYADEPPVGTWFYKVVAVDTAGNASAASGPASATVAPPADVSAPSVPGDVSASVAGSTVSLSWSASTDDVGVTGYRVYRGGSAGFPAGADSLVAEGPGTSFSDPDRPVGTSFYKVAAVDAAGNASAASAAVSATVAAPDAEPVTQTVVASADTMVAAVNPAYAYGSGNQLSSRANTAIESLLRFDLPAAPAGLELSAVTIAVRTSGDPAAGSGDVHEFRFVDGAWEESSVTWATRPTAVQPTILGALSGAAAVNTPYSAALSPSAFGPHAGSSITLRMSSASGQDNIRLWSREAGAAAYRPTLTLTYE